MNKEKNESIHIRHRMHIQNFNLILKLRMICLKKELYHHHMFKY